VSRQPLIDSNYSTVICAPVFTHRYDLPTQVAVHTTEGLKDESAIQCDGLMSLEKSRLTDFLGELAPSKLRELDNAPDRRTGDFHRHAAAGLTTPLGGVSQNVWHA
jgi:mRNA interferase MazF